MSTLESKDPKRHVLTPAAQNQFADDAVRRLEEIEKQPEMYIASPYYSQDNHIAFLSGFLSSMEIVGFPHISTRDLESAAHDLGLSWNAGGLVVDTIGEPERLRFDLNMEIYKQAIRNQKY